MNSKPFIGQQVFSLNVGNYARKGVPQVLTPFVVIAVGRKYFTACEERHRSTAHMHVQFQIEDWRQKTDYSATHKLYPSEQAWKDEEESRSLCDIIRKSFDHWSTNCVPLESLRTIVQLIEAAKEAR